MNKQDHENDLKGEGREPEVGFGLIILIICVGILTLAIFLSS